MEKKYELVYTSREWINGSGWSSSCALDTLPEYASKLPTGRKGEIAYRYLNWVEDGLLDTDDYRDRDYSTGDTQYSVEFYRLNRDGERVSDDPARTYSIWESALHKLRFEN